MRRLEYEKRVNRVIDHIEHHLAGELSLEGLARVAAFSPFQPHGRSGGAYAVAEFVGSAREIEGIWDRVFSAWLPASGYQPDDRPCFELYRGDPSVDPKAKTFRAELCLPVRPL